MSFFKNLEAGLNSGLDALAQEYGKVQEAEGAEGGGSPSTPGLTASEGASVGQRMSALLNAVEPNSLTSMQQSMQQSATGALKALTPKVSLPTSADALFPGAADESPETPTAAALPAAPAAIEAEGGSVPTCTSSSLGS